VRTGRFGALPASPAGGERLLAPTNPLDMADDGAASCGRGFMPRRNLSPDQGAMRAGFHLVAPGHWSSLGDRSQLGCRLAFRWLSGAPRGAALRRNDQSASHESAQSDPGAATLVAPCCRTATRSRCCRRPPPRPSTDARAGSPLSARGGQVTSRATGFPCSPAHESGAPGLEPSQLESGCTTLKPRL